MIRIIDYKAGNAPSVLRAVSRLGFHAAFAREAGALDGASHILLPGVGSAKATMDSLREMSMLAALEDAVLRKKTLFFGICVGMQILFDHSEEDGADGLGWLKGRVVRFDGGAVRVPQMGWNKVTLSQSPANPALEDYFYFVNSYYVLPENPSDVWGTAEYNGRFAAAVRRENIFAAQFHAEKSGEAGLALLNGFLRQGRGFEPC
ncbi:MAG: imidazole glycerol phosphate synthase subunit HisH [Oscillospiraceae bacterium]|nr:imidazole glycerol phosphate synthase subunit HisH [Oscillospiraceae bacterium]